MCVCVRACVCVCCIVHMYVRLFVIFFGGSVVVVFFTFIGVTQRVPQRFPRRFSRRFSRCFPRCSTGYFQRLSATFLDASKCSQLLQQFNW